MVSRLIKARAGIFVLALVVFSLLSLVFPHQIQADGLAISGNFYRQHFELIPGQNITTPEIYVVVFNNGETDFEVRLTTITPVGVEMVLPATEFTLPAGESRQVEVGVSVGLQVPPGEYDLIITAETFSDGEGIKITGAAQLQAKLTVFAESGGVDIITTSPEGSPFIATLRLYKQIDGQNLPCGYSEMGSLRTQLTPGYYLVEAYYQGNKVAQENFSLATNEKKTITLVPQTVYVQGFSVISNWYSETNEFAFAKVAYSINNTYQPLKNVTTLLKVSLGNELVDEIELISLPSLGVGIMSGANYNYIPSGGWQNNSYNFTLEIYSEEELCAQSYIVELSAEPAQAENLNPSDTDLSVGNGNLNWALIGIITGGLAIVILVVFLMRRRIR